MTWDRFETIKLSMFQIGKKGLGLPNKFHYTFHMGIKENWRILVTTVGVWSSHRYFFMGKSKTSLTLFRSSKSGEKGRWC